MLSLRPYQHEAKHAVYEHLRTRDDNPCVILPTGCHAEGHPILMFDGTVRSIEQVQVGDHVMGPDSSPRRVLALCRGEDELYRVAPHRGEPFVVNGDHRLSLVRTNESTNPDRNPFGGEIEDVPLREYLTKPRWWRHVRKLYRVPVDAHRLRTDWTYSVLDGNGRVVLRCHRPAFRAVHGTKGPAHPPGGCQSVVTCFQQL